MSADKPNQYVYRFGQSMTDGNMNMKELLGGKGANLAEMSSIGLPVPPGFTIATIACQAKEKNDQEALTRMEEEAKEAIGFLEKEMGKTFGDPMNPLLLSVRSGAAISMPGMMDTVLNLGLTPEVIEGMIEASGNPRFVWDLYRRFIDMFGNVVMGVDHGHFEAKIAALKQARGVKQDIDLSADDLKELCRIYLEVYQEHTEEEFPDEPFEQLRKSIHAVLSSWNNPRAVTYRRINKIQGLLGTAVNVQSMVFGNRGETSCTGVLFTRNPANGTKELFGEYLINAQGEDVVAGIRTPSPIAELQRAMPETYLELKGHCDHLESHFRNVQDIEFTVEEGKLYILQTRHGKRTGRAAVRIAYDMVDEGLVDQREAVLKLVEPSHLEQLLHPQFADPETYQSKVLAKGLPASPGAAVGRLVFSAEEAMAKAEEGWPVILARTETSPDDVGGMHVAQGIVTSRGGMTSHAAVVARGWGKCCVAGCEALSMHETQGWLEVGGKRFEQGDWISLNGTTGEVIEGAHELKKPEISGDFAKFMGWVDELRTLKVRANAETPEDARHAIQFGAEGIGLCRTEHMFFPAERILLFREMILAESFEARAKILEKLLPFQRKDFYELFEVMSGKPVTIRLLDPPLHEFLPKTEEEQRQLAQDLNIELAKVHDTVEDLKEQNPMLGFRGCRLGIVHSQITETQVRAIFEAALEAKLSGFEVHPEIMVPLVGSPLELHHQRKLIKSVAIEVFSKAKMEVSYKIGSMIEVPRAALLADEIAEEAEFFSFGTNDLTQMTFGFSRDDAGKFLPGYLKEKILEVDPFQVLDQKGVGVLMQTALKLGKQTRPELEAGICGEHGGEPTSVEFCYRIGLNYVSCSPFRVPIARLAAAQAALRGE